MLVVTLLSIAVAVYAMWKMWMSGAMVDHEVFMTSLPSVAELSFVSLQMGVVEPSTTLPMLAAASRGLFCTMNGSHPMTAAQVSAAYSQSGNAMFDRAFLNRMVQSRLLHRIKMPDGELRYVSSSVATRFLCASTPNPKDYVVPELERVFETASAMYANVARSFVDASLSAKLQALNLDALRIRYWREELEELVDRYGASAFDQSVVAVGPDAASLCAKTRTLFAGKTCDALDAAAATPAKLQELAQRYHTVVLVGVTSLLPAARRDELLQSVTRAKQLFVVDITDDWALASSFFGSYAMLVHAIAPEVEIPTCLGTSFKLYQMGMQARTDRLDGVNLVVAWQGA
jgi:hypothetical protein